MLAEYNSTEAQGSALRESEKSAQNLTGRLNALSNSVTKLVNKFASADTIKGFVNILNNLVEGLNGMTDTFGTASPIITTFFAAFGAKNVGILREVNSEATKFSERFGIMHQSFANIASDFKNGLGLRSFTGAAKQSDIDNYNQYLTAVKNGTADQETFNTLMGKAPARLQANAKEIASLITKNQELAKSQNIINQDYKDGKVQEQEYSRSMASTNKQMQTNSERIQQLSSNTETLTLKQRALNAVMNVGKMAFSMLGNALIGLAISAAINVIGKLINAAEEARQKAQEAAETLQEENDTIDEQIESVIQLRKALDDNNLSESETANTKEQLLEIQTNLVDKYGEEAKGIDLVNGKLVEQIDNYNKLKQAKIQEAYRENTSGYNTAYDKMTKQNAVLTGQRLISVYNANSNDIMSFYQDAYKELIKAGFKSYTNEAGTKVGDITGDLQLQGDIYTINEALQKAYDSIKQRADSSSKEVQDAAKVTLEYLSSVISDYSKKTIDENEAMYGQMLIYNSTTYSKDFQALLKAQSEYRIAQENNDVEQITEIEQSYADTKRRIIEYANSVGDTAVVKYLEKYFNDLASAEDKATVSTDVSTDSASNLTTALEKLKDVLSDFDSTTNTYTSAMQKIAEGTALTAKEIQALLELDPELANKFKITADGFTFDYEDLLNSYQKKKDGFKQSVQNQDDITTLKSERESLQKEYEKEANLLNDPTRFKRISYLKDKLNNGTITNGERIELNNLINKVANYEKLNNLLEQIRQKDEEIAAIESVSDMYDTSEVQSYIEAMDDVPKKVDEYNDSISDLNKVITTLNSGTSLSYDEMINLTNLYPQLSSKIIQTADGYQIEISALEDVRQQSYKTRDDYIKKQEEITKSLIENVRNRITAYKAEIEAKLYQGNWNKHLTTADKNEILDPILSTDEAYQSLVSNLKSLNEILDKLGSYKNEVVSPEDVTAANKAVTDGLQDQLDYYNAIISAIEAETDKYIESLNKQKEANQEKIDQLNDEKDALSKKNEEQKRENDLIEAKNNLDKAKKQKIFVYKKGEGLVQVENTKAVKEAQQNLDDVQNEIAQAKIQDQIDTLEKQNELIDKQIQAAEDYKEQFTSIDTNVANMLAIQKAQLALGVSEKGLLNLSQDQIANLVKDYGAAYYKKDQADNKDNDKYISVSFDDYIKSLGGLVTGEQFNNIAKNVIGNTSSTTAANKVGSTINTSKTITNNTDNKKSITVKTNFNISGYKDPEKVADIIEQKMNKFLKDTLASIK